MKKALKIGIDNYGLLPLGMSPLQTLKWVEKNGGEGVQFSGLSFEDSQKIDHSYLQRLSDYALKKDLYIEWGGAQHIPYDMESWEKKDIYPINKKAVQEASVVGAKVVRSCSGGLMRWDSNNPDTEFLLRSTADALRVQRDLCEDFGVTLALETHFEFTTFELVRLFEMCEAEPGGYLGVCLDTMNLLTMLEEPIRAVERILPWVVSTHIKDGGIFLTPKGLVSFPCEISKGVFDFKKIFSLLLSLDGEVNLSIEDHGGSFLIPVFDKIFMKGFPDLTLDEFIEVLSLAEKTKDQMNNHGLKITPREKWPYSCDERIKKDLTAVKKIRDDAQRI
ncbi:MAG: sugar phosphate isomerase/epimerase family protein [Acidobacteriota bacterium]